MKFYDDEHKKAFESLSERFSEVLGYDVLDDIYYASFIYLVSLDPLIVNHINDVYEFDEHYILPVCLKYSYWRSTSRNTLRLAFNLFNGYCDSFEETYTDEYGYEAPVPSRRFTVKGIFELSGKYTEYYFEAIRIRLGLTR